MNEGVDDVLLYQLKIKSRRYRHHEAEGSSSKCGGVVVDSYLGSLLISSHYQSRFCLDEIPLFVEFVDHDPHTVE